MIDFHTHILPRMDDGSRRMAETQKMLKMEYDQGVRLGIGYSTLTKWLKDFRENDGSHLS